MALVEVQGFDYQLGASDLIADIATTGDEWSWSVLTLSGTLLVPGQFSGKALSLGGSGIFGGTLSTPFSNATVIVGCSLKVPVSGNVLVGFWDSGGQNPTSGTMQLCVLFDGTGVISIYRGSTGGTLLHSTAAGQFAVGSWFYAEIKVVVDSFTGSVTIQLGGSPHLSLTGLNTQAGAATVDSLFFGGGGDGFVDHVYIEDDTVGAGSNPCNDFLGKKRVFTRFPKGVGSSTQWTPLSGANYTQVLEHAMDSDTSYNYDSGIPVGDKDLFQADGTPGKIPVACKVTGSYRETGSARIFGLVNKLRSGGTEVNGATVMTFPTYTYQSDVYVQNPNGNVDWTKAAVDSSQIGYELVSINLTPAPIFDTWVAIGTYVDPTGVQGTVITSRTITYTSHYPDEVIILEVCLQCESGSPPPSVTIVSDSVGLTWTKRSSLSGNTGDEVPGRHNNYYGDHEVWWAIAPTIVVNMVVTVTVSCYLGFMTMAIGGVVGADTVSPWDTNASLPKYASNFNAASTTTQVTGVSTDATNTIPLFFYMDVFGAFTIGATPSPPLARLAGYSIVQAFIALGIDMVAFGYVANAPLVSQTFTGVIQFPGTPGPQSGWILIADALRANPSFSGSGTVGVVRSSQVVMEVLTDSPSSNLKPFVQINW